MRFSDLQIRERPGFHLERLGDILNEQDMRSGREYPDYVNLASLVDDDWSTKALEHIANAYFHGRETGWGYLVEESGLVCTPTGFFYFDASEGPILAPMGSTFYLIDTGRIFPLYLIMQLYEPYAQHQYTGRRMNPYEFDDGEMEDICIYIPDGSPEFSLYEQQQIFYEYRNREIDNLFKVSGFSFAQDRNLPYMTALQHGQCIVKECLGSGGFGKMYKATLKHSGQHLNIALKELFIKEFCVRNPLTNNVNVNPQMVAEYYRWKNKMRKEYDILRRLSMMTSYVPCVYGDLFEENNTLYYAMQFIENGTIWTHSRNKTLDRQERLGIICHAGIALHYAHDLDYLHLDVTPLNIMVDDFNKGKLIDFGNAKHYSVEVDAFTSEGRVAKTRLFAAPELLHQHIGEYLMQTDVYGLAATLYTTMTGRTPEYERYDEADNNYMNTIVDEMQKAGLHESIIESVKKGMAYHAEDRQASVLDFLKYLIPAIEDEKLIEEIRSLAPVRGFNRRNHKAVCEREAEGIEQNLDSE